MAQTLPDGTSVTSQFVETWESIGKSFPDQQGITEGWESPIFIMGKFSAGPDQTVTEGEPATLSGVAQDEDGNALGGNIPFTVKLRDSDGNVVDSTSGSTASDGSYSADVVPPSPGEYEAITENDKIGKQAPTETWEEIGVTFTSQFGPEGWES